VLSVRHLERAGSQGATEQEALENVGDAIRDYLSVVEEQLQGDEIREIEIAF
jgi:predicted RNase H-like HicB family nuclease